MLQEWDHGIIEMYLRSRTLVTMRGTVCRNGVAGAGDLLQDSL
jgi:hypothetical protein